MTVTTSAALAAPGESGSPVELDARYENLIGGEWVRPTNGEYRENPTPSTGETFCAVAGGRVRESDLFFFRCAHISACDRSTVKYELALRPGHSPQVRMPPTALLASRGTEYGLLVLTAGLGRMS